MLLPLQLGQAALELQAVDERDERRLQNLQILSDLTGLSGVVRPTPAGGGHVVMDYEDFCVEAAPAAACAQT